MSLNINSPRIIGLDLVRSIAILFVISGHFFSLNTPFRSTIFGGVNLTLQSITIPLFSTGVPLFLMLTGYLNANKSPSRKYYKGCIRVLFAYLLFSFITILFRKYYLSEDLSWTQWILKILDYSAIPYAWYIEMWIGLFLLTPFLNYMYKAIPSRRLKLTLLVTLYLLTAVPDLFNRYGMHIVPGFWSLTFPLMFFFAGSYIREYRPHPKKWFLIVAIILMCSINPIFNLLFVNHHTLIQIAGGYYGVFGTLIAIAFFLLIYDMNTQVTAVRVALTKISILSLDMYLCCYMFDQLAYPYFLSHYFVDQSQFGPYFFIVVPLVFIGSFILAWGKDAVCKRISPLL